MEQCLAVIATCLHGLGQRHLPQIRVLTGICNFLHEMLELI
eukprot:CAMPEP_0181415526 /NCGR_PEP_ID=MMETSP1110-20121109/10061_1 /TAXON_ID=174948 /ORGANISM="Symbiodinium sp., Strain CCMP421" /LENGTH=40 /DNA_ID= /DNA_START= /DNA_END= /DNA_ORIENTATION=